MPKGRPKGSKENPTLKPFKRALNDALAGKGKIGLKKAAEKLISNAEMGDLPSIRELADRVDGKVPTEIGGSDKPIKHLHKVTMHVVDPETDA